MAKKKWIASAIKKPGALRKEMGVKEGETIPASKLNAKISRLHEKSEGGKKLTEAERTNLKRAVMARTLKGLPKRGK
jgi:hypothetical protein